MRTVLLCGADQLLPPAFCPSDPSKESVHRVMDRYSGSLSGGDYSGFAVATSGTKDLPLNGGLGRLPTRHDVSFSDESSSRKLSHHAFFFHTEAVRIRLEPDKHSVAGHCKASYRRPECSCEQVSDYIPRLAKTRPHISQKRVLLLLRVQLSWCSSSPPLCRSQHYTIATLRTPYVTKDVLVS